MFTGCIEQFSKRAQQLNHPSLVREILRLGYGTEVFDKDGKKNFYSVQLTEVGAAWVTLKTV